MVDELKRRAEELSKKSSAELSQIPPEKVRALFRELHVNQIELERQNEELRRAHTELAETRDRYADLYESAPVAYITLDRNRTIREANLTFVSLLGIQPDRVEKRKLDEFIAPEQRDACLRNIHLALTSDRERSFETQFQAQGKGGFWGLVKCVPVEPHGGGTAGCRAAISNITALKAAETMLQVSKERLELALDAGEMGLWDHDLERDEVIWNDRLYSLLGYPSRVAVTPETFFEHIHEADLSRVRRHVGEVLGSGGTEFVDEFRVVRRDGDVRWLAARGRVVRDTQGTPVRMTGVNFDTTPWKEEEGRLERLVKERTAELVESERRYRELVENMNDIVYAVDEKGMVRFISPQIERYGLRVDEIVGRHFLEFVAVEDRERMKANLNDNLITGESIPSLFRLRNPENRAVWMEETGSLQRDPANYLVGATGVLRDVTRRVATEQQNIRQREALRTMALRLEEAQEQERQRIAAGLHDEVAQLLAACQLKLAEAEVCTDENERHAMFEVANHLLDEASDQIRMLTFELSSRALVEGGFVAALGELCTHMKDRHGVEFELECADWDDAIPERQCSVLYRGLRELLHNTAKHAGVNRAVVRIEQWEDCGNVVDDRERTFAGAFEKRPTETGKEPGLGSLLLRITVRDYGRGFDIRTLDRPLTPKGGFGLRHLRERMADLGGRFYIESSPEDGTTAVMEIPLDTGSASRVSRNRRPRKRRKHVRKNDQGPAR